MVDIEKNYQKFVKYAKAYIKRDGIDELLAWLDKSDTLKNAPATAKYYGNYEGGLIKHSIDVFMRMIKLLGAEYGDLEVYSKETIALVSLFHDIGKLGMYKKVSRNVKNEETGNWEKVESWAVKDEEEKFVLGTVEENTLYLLNKFLTLNREESIALMYVNGCNAEKNDFANSRMFTAYKTSPLAMFLHIADELAISVDGVETTPKSVEKAIKAKEEKEKAEQEEEQETPAEEVSDNEQVTDSTVEASEGAPF